MMVIRENKGRYNPDSPRLPQTAIVNDPTTVEHVTISVSNAVCIKNLANGPNNEQKRGFSVILSIS